jgi:hypothetical protein
MKGLQALNRKLDQHISDNNTLDELEVRRFLGKNGKILAKQTLSNYVSTGKIPGNAVVRTINGTKFFLKDKLLENN